MPRATKTDVLPSASPQPATVDGETGYVVSDVREAAASVTQLNLDEAIIGIDLPSSDATLREVGTAIAALPPGKLVPLLEIVVQKGLGEQMKDIIGILQIMTTESRFDTPGNKEILEQTAKEYSLAMWIGQQEGMSLSNITRNDLQRWWGFFTEMAAQKGCIVGRIDQTNQNNNLWNATRRLSEKMGTNPKAYMYLPPILIDNPDQVARALAAIQNPTAFIEVLVGEAWEDLCRSEEFLNAFSTIPGKGGKEGAIATVMLALQRNEQPR